MSEHTTTQQPTTAQPEWAEKIKVCEFQGVKKFYDIMPLLADGDAFDAMMGDLTELAEEMVGEGLFRYKVDGGPVDQVVATEARGFIIGSALASCNNLGLVPLRKPGKTPGTTASVAYGKEYGDDALELQKGLILEGANVLIVDDLLATGGTLEAAAKLVEDQGAKVLGIVVMIELTELGGRERLEKAGYKLVSALQY